jgi:SAM-dependent methyltransferase
MKAMSPAHRLANARAMLDLIGAGWTTQVLATAAELGVADRLARGPARAADMARDLKCDGDGLERLLRALVSIGLCEPRAHGRYALLPAGALLREGVRDSVRSWALWCGRHSWSIWGDLAGSIRQGVSARRRARETPLYSHLAENDEAARTFHNAMAEIARVVGRDVARACDFSGASHLVDVGGGHGELLAEILLAHPRLRGTVVDLPHATRGTIRLLAAAGLDDRAAVVDGNFFESVPVRADLYLLKSILHNWDDAKALAILETCRRAMEPGARLVLVERLLPARPAATRRDRSILRSDLNMLVGHAGRERTREGYRALLSRAGFRLARVRAVALDYSVIECAAVVSACADPAPADPAPRSRRASRRGAPGPATPRGR